MVSQNNERANGAADTTSTGRLAAPESLARFPSLKGKRIFVTGGGSGIGEAIVTAFAEQGAGVAFIDIAVDPSVALCERLATRGLEPPQFRECDIRNIEALQETIRELSAALGDFDVLVNNAADDTRHRPEDVSVAFYDERIAINQRPMFFSCQAVLPGMKKNRGGSIINLGSTSWHMAGGGYPVYTATKAAVSGLTRGLARDLGPYNIRVNTVTPGWVMTERQLALWVNDEAEKVIDQSQCLPGRVLPWHVARMVLFLAADDSAMCTAQEFIVDGGWV